MQITPEIERAGLLIFTDSLDQSDAQLEAWLVAACQGNEVLHGYVLKLLAADAADTPESDFLSASNDEADNDVAPAQIGPYRLEELIGAGGMGLVYRGQRNDGLFEQTVAIKFIRKLRGVVDIEPLIDSERKLLARVEHPGIARILDGGSAPNGMPYLVMEFVRGSALDEFAAEHRLDVRQRIALLREACAAVTHAHQNLVLHCDIKPANILVTHDGHVKLIDFGVARIQDVADASRPEGFTRGYTSPQRLSGTAPTVADDIFSLGIVLKELVLAASSAPDPSMPAELVAIVSRATAPERADRYASAAALDDDLRLWLENRPVAAVGHHWRYRARKLVARHPWRVAVAVTAFAGLLIALTAVSLLYRRAEIARAQAENRFTQVRSLAKFMMFDLYDRLDGMAHSLTLRRDVAAMSQQYLSKLATDPGASPDLQIETVEGLVRLASVQGTGSGSRLNQLDQARANLAQADLVAARLQSEGLAQWRLAHLRARILLQQARLQANVDNDVHAAEPSLKAARDQLDRAIVQAPDDAELRWTDADWHVAAALIQSWEGNYPQAQALARTAQEAIASFPPAKRSDRTTSLLESEATDVLAEALYYSGDAKGAEHLYADEVAQLERAQAHFTSDGSIARYLVRAQWALGTTLLNNGKIPEALILTGKAKVGARALSAEEPEDADALRLTAAADLAYAQTLSAAGRKSEAIVAFTESVAQRHTSAMQDPGNASLTRSYAVGLFALADFHADAGNPSEACRLYVQGFESFAALERAGKLTEVDRNYAMKQALDRRASLKCR